MRRLFEPRVLRQLAPVALGRRAGFALDEITAMSGADGTPRIHRDRLSAKAGELDTATARLKAMRDALRRAACCPEAAHTDCPKLQRLLKLARRSALPEAPSAGRAPPSARDRQP